MALDIDNQTHERRPIGFVLLGIVLLGLAGWLGWSVVQQKSTTAPVTPQTYEYKITQTLDSPIRYFQSSFYDNKPGAGNTAYVTKLTDKISPTFNYTFEATKDTELTYYYSVKAVVKATYMVAGNTEEAHTVWMKEFPLVKPEYKTATTKTVAIKRTIDIPYAEYKTLVDTYKTGLGLPTSFEMVVSFTVQTSGTIDGTRFDDARTSTISAPLDQDVYKLAVKTDKEDKKQVVTKQAKDNNDISQTYQLIGAGVIGAIGVCAIVFGMRRKIFKTPYERELDRIFRYHDGIIIRASKQADLKDKNIVPVKTFDDILNLEEELKTPIVACPAGSEATQFIIVHGDVVYMYTLGRVFVDSDSFHAVEESLAIDEVIAPVRRKAAKKKARRTIQ